MSEVGTVSFTTMNSDGRDRTVHVPPIATLNMGPGAATLEGRIAFNGWDESNPANTGVWIGSRDLSDIEHVVTLPEGVVATDPMGIAPDGSRILFFGEVGPQDFVTHTGDLFVVNEDGTGLRKLNPDNLSLAMVTGRPASLSPDGERAAFAAFEGEPSAARSAVFVVSLRGGEAKQVTEWTGGIWTAVWAPVGEKVTSRRNGGMTVPSCQWSMLMALGRMTCRLPVLTTSDSVPGPLTAIIFWSGRGPESLRDLWVLDLEGSFLGQVTHEPSNYAVYSWAPASAGS